MCFRLWSCSYKQRYKGFDGKVKYFKRYALKRLLDIWGILVYIGYVIFNLVEWGRYINYPVDTIFRLLHLVQILQIHRIMFKLGKTIVGTFSSQMNQLILAFIGNMGALVFSSHLVFMTEHDYTCYNQSQFTIFDSYWLSFLTFTTIG